jgi:hypothetical protein
MTPTLIGRKLSPALGPDYRPLGYPGPCSSVPPPTSYAPQTNLRDSYEPVTSVPTMSLVLGGNLPPLHTSHEGDPFQVRPRSSQFNHPYPGGVSARSLKNQNQAMHLFGGSGHFPHPANILPYTPFPPTFAPSCSPAPLHSFSQSSTTPSIYPNFSVPPHSFLASRDPHAAPAAQAVLSAQSRPALASSSVQLLSILNGDRASEAHSSTSRAGPPSTSISVHAT